MKKNKLMVLFGILAALIVLVIVISLPPVWSRVSYYTQQIYSTVKYKLFPPQDAVFTPGGNDPGFVATSVQATMNAAVSTPTPTTSAPENTPQPTVTATPLPGSILLNGVKPEAQRFNNCGPATLSMNLSYWNWTPPAGQNYEVPQDFVAPILKPYNSDKNVMPYEMENMVNQYTDLRATVRMGGDLQLLKTLLSQGFPVLIEKGFEPENIKKEGWMGHYNLIIGYDDAKQEFTTEDSYLLALIPYEQRENSTGFKVSYADLEKNWRAFNFIFIVVYPPDKANDVLNTLGPLADEQTAFSSAYKRAMVETTTLSDPRDTFFAWYNAGTSLVYLQDYLGAAAAFDTAFNVYPNIEPIYRPWRMLWYQTGPYFAYYYTARYQDVINLADKTLKDMAEPILEESFYWRALAKLALGDQDNAIDDLRESLKYHPDFGPTLQKLQELGVSP